MDPEPKDVLERRFELLLDEKQHVDTQVGKCFDRQLTITGVHFTALAAAAGWIFSRSDGSANYVPVSLLVIAALSCFGSAQSIIVNALLLHYTRYKQFILGPQFAEALGLSQSPLRSLAELANPENPSRKLAAIASVLSASIALVVNAGAVCYAFVSNPHLWIWCVFSAVGLGVTAWAQLSLWKAQTRTYSEALKMSARDT